MCYLEKFSWFVKSTRHRKPRVNSYWFHFWDWRCALFCTLLSPTKLLHFYMLLFRKWKYLNRAYFFSFACRLRVSAVLTKPWSPTVVNLRLRFADSGRTGSTRSWTVGGTSKATGRSLRGALRREIRVFCTVIHFPFHQTVHISISHDWVLLWILQFFSIIILRVLTGSFALKFGNCSQRFVKHEHIFAFMTCLMHEYNDRDVSHSHRGLLHGKGRMGNSDPSVWNAVSLCHGWQWAGQQRTAIC